MSKLEYLNPKDWSLHVIDGEGEFANNDWILVPKGAEIAILRNGNLIFFRKKLKKVVGDLCDFLYSSDGFLGWRSTLKDPLNVQDDEKMVWTRKMKEYLVERDGKYELVEAYHLGGGVEIPDGAEEYKSNGKFYKDNGKYFYSITNSWFLSEYFNFKILWQRKPSLNDQYVEIERVRQNNLKAAGVEDTLSERQSQYGDFKDVAELTSELMADLLREDMTFVQRESLHMICSKLARIKHGDVNKIDSWHDIAGYATLVVKDLEGK